MAWRSEIIEALSAEPVCGYHLRQAAATEPTALAALALLGEQRATAAYTGLRWLADLQTTDGAIGVSAHEATPNWPTAWAVMAWTAAQSSTGNENAAWNRPSIRAINWIANATGQPMQSVEQLGHDPNLKGWPWVDGTHSWIEPTSLALLAFKAAGQGTHPRAREAVRLIYDRQLPHGGCNYGNTIVLGQELLPHVQPTGLAMLALAGEKDPQGRIEKGLTYLRSHLDQSSAVASLCYGLFALTIHGQRPAAADQWLQAAAQRTKSGDRSPYKYALLLLAAQAEESALLQLFRAPKKEAVS